MFTDMQVLVIISNVLTFLVISTLPNGKVIDLTPGKLKLSLIFLFDVGTLKLL